MSASDRNEVKALIQFYDKRGWDWSQIVEYLVLKMNKSLGRAMNAHKHPSQIWSEVAAQRRAERKHSDR